MERKSKDKKSNTSTEISTKLNNGVLTIEIPITTPPKPKSSTIRVQ